MNLTLRTMTQEGWIALTEILLITVLPVLLIQLGIIPKDYRIQLYGLMYSLIIPVFFIHKLRLKDYSIRLDNFWAAAKLFGIEALILLILGFILAFVVEYRIQTGVGRVVNPLQYLLVSVPIQQLVYFGFLYNRLTVVTTNKFIIALTIAILFAASHLPWDNLEFTIVAFGLGLMWSSIYVFRPNLIWSFSLHIIIGLFSLIIVQLG